MAEPRMPLNLPDGTRHTPLTWDELVPYECDQGGYWLYGPWCDVYGNGKIFIRVRPDEAAPDRRTYMDNPPACGALKNWRWGYLPCGCHNDGYGRHVR